MNVAEVAREVASHGERDDKILAHLPRKAAAYLARRYGGDVNPKTGLPSFDFWSNIGGAIGGFFGGGNKSPGNTAYSELSAETKPLLAAGQQDLSQYQSGQLKPGDQQALNSAMASGNASLKQLYANAGLGDSSMLVNQEQNVTNEGVQLRQQLLNSYLQEALGAYGTAFQPLAQAIGYQFQGNTNTQNLLGGAIGGIFGQGGLGSELFSGGGLFSGLFSTASGGVDPNQDPFGPDLNLT